MEALLEDGMLVRVNPDTGTMRVREPSVFRSHKRENPACPLCTKYLSSECVECEEKIELRPGLLFLHFLCAFLSYSTHCFKCLILNFPPCFEMHSVSYILMQRTQRNHVALHAVCRRVRMRDAPALLGELAPHQKNLSQSLR